MSHSDIYAIDILPEYVTICNILFSNPALQSPDINIILTLPTLN